MGFSEGGGGGGGSSLLRVGPATITRVLTSWGCRVGRRGCEDRGRGQDLRWVHLLLTSKMEKGTPSLEKTEKAGKQDPP